MGECKITALRMSRRLSIVEFCKTVGITRQTYWMADKKGIISRKTVCKVCDALNCSEWWVNGELDEEPRTEHTYINEDGIIQVVLSRSEIELVKNYCYKFDISRSEFFEEIIKKGLSQIG